MHREPRLRMVERSELADVGSCPACDARLPRRSRREAWIEVPIGNQWVAAYRIVVKNQIPLVAEVRLVPDAPARRQAGRWSGKAADVPSGGVPGRALRALRLKDPFELFPKVVENLKRRMGEHAARQVLGRFGMVGTAPVVPLRPGRAGRADEFYALWAAAYVERISSGSHHPVWELAANPPVRIRERQATKHLSGHTVRDVLREARGRDLLTSPPMGRSGGELTPKARRLLRKLGREN